MNSRKIDLLKGEKIIFESDPAVLTNRRLLANWKGGRNGKASDEAHLSDIAKFEKIVGGQESRNARGLSAIAVGLVLMAASSAISNAQSTVQSIVFVAGALAVVIGFQFILTSLVRLKPHTTIFFETKSDKHIAISFPGRDNPQADEFARAYSRTKRDLML